jgi:hypothetical protein
VCALLFCALARYSYWNTTLYYCEWCVSHTPLSQLCASWETFSLFSFVVSNKKSSRPSIRREFF